MIKSLFKTSHIRHSIGNEKDASKKVAAMSNDIGDNVAPSYKIPIETKKNRHPVKV